MVSPRDFMRAGLDLIVAGTAGAAFSTGSQRRDHAVVPTKMAAEKHAAVA
jgi:hypothetical protein